MMATKENPFRAKIRKKPLRKFGAKKRVEPPAKVGRNGRACKYRKGMKVRMTWRQYPEFGGDRREFIGLVKRIEWSKSGATVVFGTGKKGEMRYCCFAPGNSRLTIVRQG